MESSADMYNHWMKKLFITAIILIVLLVSLRVKAQEEDVTWWEFQSIDTMKYSRDVAREKSQDPTFDTTIEEQVKRIAEAGATHISIATPYDSEFLPFMLRWVKMARKYGLNVWFRGNWSGWEEWFGYDPISRSDHLTNTKEFIVSNRHIFEDGDVFTACPECENGGPGDPRNNGDVDGHRKFLIDEYKITKSTFSKIGKKVKSNYNSMNGDVANLVMDRETTSALDGLVVVDHYVSTPEKLVADIKRYAQQSGGKVILGEFGAPIPDIHGDMSEEEQKDWLEDAMGRLAATSELIGLNYWTSHGSSTQLWTNSGEPKAALSSITKFFSPRKVDVEIRNEIGRIVANTSVEYVDREFNSSELVIPIIDGHETLTVSAQGYMPVEVKIGDTDKLEVVLVKQEEDWLFKLQKLLSELKRRIIP